MRCRKVGHVWGFLAVIIILSSGASLLGDEALQDKRLAVIGDAAAQKSGLTDLIANDLQKTDVELVEREKLAAVVNEQALGAAFGAESSRPRAHLGQLVQADVLVLLQSIKIKQETGVMLIVAECRQGMRLDRRAITFKSAPAVAQYIADVVTAARHRFSHGVTSIVAVPPFIARNFTYEYHPLQTGIANLLEESLAKIPGVAVAELDEARAIRKELDVGGGKVGGIMPIFVEGEFEVVVAADKSRTINFKINIDGQGKPRTIERKDLPYSQGPAFITQQLPTEILPDANAQQADAFPMSNSSVSPAAPMNLPRSANGSR